LPEKATSLTVEKFPDGQSNPTYKLSVGNAHYVLRRKPFGDLLPSAHAVDREYRLLCALHPTGFPVPRPIALCEDENVIGSMFYLMEMVDGRTFWDGTLPELPASDRRAYYESMIDTMAALHAIDYQATGLGDFAPPGNYVQRQVARWTKQYRAAQTDQIREIEWLIDWLPNTVPEQTSTSIIHGDYRIDNLLYDPADPQVIAVLDWELATIGDPLADFAYLAMNWALPRDGRSGLVGVDLQEAGLPSLDEAVARYCAASGRDNLPNLHWYFAYNLFRLACIIQGIKKRLLGGNASSDKAASYVAMIEPLAKAAWAEALKAGATKAYAAAGAKVVISSRKQTACVEVAAAIKEQHGEQRAIAIAASISDKQALEHLVSEVRAQLGKIDILVCNAASNPYYGPLAGISDEQFRKIFDNNVLSNHWLTSMVAPEMIERKEGAIIIVSSDLQLVRNLAIEYGPHNVRINAIAPGVIRTDFAKALWEDPKAEAHLKRTVPLARIGEPENIAGPALMLASKAGEYIHGQTIVVDGGTTIKGPL